MARLTKIKLMFVFAFLAFGAAGLVSNHGGIVQTVEGSSSGPPAGFTGSPDEPSCTVCHLGSAPAGQFAVLNAPAIYVPGQTYQLQVQHTSSDTTRKRWGFEMVALADIISAGTFSNFDSSTKIITNSGRSYIEHSSTGTFQDQTGGAQWTVNWTAPSPAVGPVTFYAAGVQSNNNHGPEGDEGITTFVVSRQQSGTPYDFDGDRKSDAAVYRPSAGDWYLLRSTAGFGAFHFGSPSDIFTPADYTGDGRTDMAVFRPSNGIWYVLRSENFTFYGAGFGASGDVPSPGDFDGDGKADTVVFRPSNGTWFLQQSTAGFNAVQFGQNGDVPAAGDFDGDGKNDISVYRPSLGQWFRLNSQNGSFYGIQFGSPGDKIVPADYTGDGKTDYAVFRPSTSNWYILRSENNTFYGGAFGATGDLPSPGDYDGDGKADLAVWRPGTQSVFYIMGSTSGFTVIPWGIAEDRPVANAFVY